MVRGLIWTGNGEAEEKSARVTVQNLFDSRVPKGYLYLGGHRPVQGNYKALQDGFYIQIHNPGKQNIVFALGVKFAVMLLGALGFAGMWMAVFADVGVALLAILNALRCSKV